MLNQASTEVEQTVLQGIAKDDETTAQEIRERMFAWEDLAAIDKRSMQKILGAVDTRTLSIALKACQPEVEDNVMSNLSARVRDMVTEERELAGAGRTTVLSTTHQSHVNPAGGTAATELMYRVPLMPSFDGNTVDVQSEQAAFAENNLQYQAALSFLDGRFKGLKSAIKGE